MTTTTSREAIVLLVSKLSDDNIWYRHSREASKIVHLGKILRELGIEGLLDEHILLAALEIRGIEFKSIDSLCTYPGIGDTVLLEVIERTYKALVPPLVVVDSYRPVPLDVVHKKLVRRLFASLRRSLAG